MKKTLKQMINEGKNRQIEIDEKPPNPEETKEKNRQQGWKQATMSLLSCSECWWQPVDRVFIW